jgi:hypothetical protein
MIPLTHKISQIFHPSDPIAYRIEPLLLTPALNPDDLPPPVYLTIPGKDVRLHLKARQIGEEIRKSMHLQKNTWNVLLSTATSALTSFSAETGHGHDNKVLSPDQLVFPLGGKSSRVDFVLQTGVVDNEYLR